MSANLELKARCADLAAARERAKVVATAWLGVDEQVDTYFRVPASEARSEPTRGLASREASGVIRPGRLKLRESSLSGGQLVPYLRPDAAAARRSDYVLIPVPEPARARELLAALFGVHCVVRKTREIALCENVRIHLDRVEGLGDFVELEAVWDGSPAGQAEQARKIAFLCEALGIRAEDLVAGSYEGMLAPAR
jgi:adenylate cyclase class IV